MPRLGGEPIKLAGCCEIVQHELMGKLASTDSTTTREVLNFAPTTGMMRLPRNVGFFCKKTVDKKELLRKIKASENVAQTEKEVAEAVEGINPYTEAQELMNRLQRGGHGHLHFGFFWLKDKVSAEYEEIEPDRFVKLFPPVAAGAGHGGTIECVVLNACETEDVGKKLRKAGVP